MNDSEREADAEKIFAFHSKWITRLEERKAESQEITVPDFIRYLEELKTLVEQNSLAYFSLQIFAQIKLFQKTISEFPRILPVKHQHKFTDKPVFLLGAFLILISALIVGLNKFMKAIIFVFT